MTQLEIFGSNQFQYSKSIVGIYRKPLANISLCILAPLPLNCLRSAYTISSEHPVKIRCLAIDDSGLVIVAPLLKFDGDCEKLLSQLIESIEETKLNILDSNGPITPILMENIKDARFWNIHNKTSSSLVEQWVEVARNNNYIEHISIDSFYKYLSDQLIENINESINYLNPFIKEVIILRPDLDLTIISNFMYRAKVYGGNALEYAKQALRIEPIPILRLIASDPNGKLFDSVFSGESLPKTLSKYLSISRSNIKYLSKNALYIPDMSIRVFIAALKVIQYIEEVFWPNDKRTWDYFIECIEESSFIVGNKTKLVGAPIFEAVSTRFKLIYNRHGTLVWQNRLVKHAPGTSIEKSTIALYEAMQGIISDVEVSGTSNSIEYKADGFSYQFAMRFLEKTPERFCTAWFKFQPDLAPIVIGIFEFQILNTLSICNYFGKVFNNCLTSSENILIELFPNKMLFCISENNKPIALLTVAINQVFSGGDTVDQLRGVKNIRVGGGVKKACVRFMIALETHKEKMSRFYLLSNALHFFQYSHNRVN